MARLAVAAVLLLAVAASASMSWKSCAKSTPHCPVSKVTMSPEPATKGQNVTFSVTCDSDETITGGTITSTVTYMGIQVKKFTSNVCNGQCPVAPGTHTTGSGAPIPTSAPSGTYGLNIVAVDQNNAPLECLDITFKVA
eukprot:PLAT14268.1.p2 GENE.PLAT14268.1~~PLAT14268.1.p2  ORF type:complete len:139 (-),score=46.05 PLAT14268.1:394-810(-)